MSEKSTAAVGARGRSAASKPLNASSKAKSTSSASGSNPSRTPSASSTVSSKSSASGSTSAAHKAASSSRTPSESGTGFKVTKLSSTTVTLQTTWTPKPASESIPASASAPIAEQPSTRTADPLQVAAQVYPWTYMTSTLDACFKGAETAATTDLETRATELSAEEAEIADQRDRLEAERSIEFFEELGSDPFAKKAPAIMQLFHSHGESCTRIETEALKLAMRSAPNPPEEEPLKVYQDMLHDLEELHHQATDLQSSIIKLTEGSSTAADTTEADEDDSSAKNADTSAARLQVNGVFAACLPVLRARIANLSMAQELIDSTLENVSLGLRMESMGLND